MSAQQIDPRLYGHLPQHPHHHQQQQPHHPHHQQQPHQYSQQVTPPQPVRLPHIHQVHDLNARIPQPYHHQQQQQSFYRLPPAHPPPFPTTSPSAAATPLPQRQDHAHYNGSDPRQEQYNDDVGSPGAGANGDPNDLKRSRACEACRGLKVRCDQNPDDPSLPCKRCAKAKRTCIITAPSRKRQKKTDSRVAELEKKIDALTASLNAQKEGGGTNGTYGSDEGQDSPEGYSPGTKPPSPALARRASVAMKKEPERKMSFAAIAGGPRNGETTVAGIKRRRSEVQGEATPPHPRPNSNANSADGDAPSHASAAVNSQIDEIIDRKLAARIFDRYVKEMAQHLPVVVFDPGTTAAEVRLTRPILFLAILVAASKGLTPLPTQDELNEALLDIYADSIIRKGAKTLELVQALLISVIWYRPPKRYEQMNFYQLSHIAAVMAIDIGLGKRLKKTWRTMGPAFTDGRTPRNLMLTDTVEVRRTWLGCYFQCSNTSMSLRRPNLIRWTNYMDECIEMLETSSEALTSDKLLCQHVKLQHVNEDIGMSFSMDDPSATVTISDTKVQYSLRGFEKNLSDWKKAVPKEVYNTALEYSAHTTGLYMHEVALHINHNVDDFRAPFTEESLKAASGQSDVLSPAHSSALSECLTSVHGIFNTFFSFDLDTVRALPIFYFVRVAYAVVVLIKLHFAVTAPGSEIGKIINKNDLTVENHLNKLLGIFNTIAKEDAFRPANKFLIILEKLRNWFERNKDLKPSQFHSREPSRWSAQYDSPSEMGQPTLPSQATQDEKGPASHQTPQQSHLQPPPQSTQQQARPRPVATQSQPPPISSHPSHQRLPPQYTGPPPATPLHFLSEVAMTHSPHQNVAPQPQTQPTSWGYAIQQQQAAQQQAAQQQAAQQHQQQQQQAQMQQQQAGQPPPAMDPNMDVSMGGMGLDYMGLGGGFEQAMDMTLGPGGADGDINSLFMGEPLFSFGLGMGMDGMEPGGSLYGMGW